MTIEPEILNEPVAVWVSVTMLPNLVPVAFTMNSAFPPKPAVNVPVTAALPDIDTEPVNLCTSAWSLPNAVEPLANCTVMLVTDELTTYCCAVSVPPIVKLLLIV
jgi:hypothetical protein